MAKRSDRGRRRDKLQRHAAILDGLVNARDEPPLYTERKVPGADSEGRRWWPFGKRRSDGFVFKTYVPTQIVRKRAEDKERRDARMARGKAHVEAGRAHASRGISAFIAGFKRVSRDVYQSVARGTARVGNASVSGATAVSTRLAKSAMQAVIGLGRWVGTLGTRARDGRWPDMKMPKIAIPALRVQRAGLAKRLPGLKDVGVGRLAGATAVVTLAVIGLATVGSH
ncbi:MAG: hypothetical protein AAFY64_08440, partial [Pseudomonadota bacterium]